MGKIKIGEIKMKKLGMLLIAVCLGSWMGTPVYAQPYYQKKQGTNGIYFVPVSSTRNQSEYGIQSGDVLISGFGGYSFSVNKVEDAEWGRKGGPTWGGSVLVFPSRVFGIGAEFNSTQFSEVEFGNEWTGLYMIDEYAKVKMDNVLLAMRFNINPNSRLRFYFPLGAGISFQRIESKATVKSLALTVKETDKGHGFAYYGGLGVEASLSKNLILGAEARLQGAHIDEEDFLSIAGLVKLGVKF